MARILVSGYYGFGNLGDEALLSGLARGLGEMGHQVTVLSADPAATRKLHGLGAAHRLRGVLGALPTHDALVSGGGGLLQDRTSRRSLEYYLGLIRAARLLGKRTVVYGQSIGPLSPQGRKAVARALRGVPVAVRDEASRALLDDLGVPAARTADCALLLEPPASAAFSPAGDAPILLIPRGGYPEITAGLIVLGRALAAQGQRVAALALQPSEDGPCLTAMQAALPALEVVTAHSPEEALEGVARARYIVSGRLHGLVFAALAHRGFSGLVYDPKVAAFLQETARPAHVLPLDSAALAAEVLAPRALDHAALDAARARAKQGVTWLHSVLEER